MLCSNTGGASNWSRYNFTVSIDSVVPALSFVSETPANDSMSQTLVINVSSADNLGNGSVFLDFNRSLVGWWRFNNETGENASQFKDYSSWGNNATCTGTIICPTYNASGKYGGAYTHVGASGVYVDTAKALSNFISASDGTISVWMKPEGTAFTTGRNFAYEAPGVIIDAGGYIGIHWGNTNNGDRIWVYNYDGTTDEIGITYTASEWVNIVWVHTGGNLYGYKNGQLVSSTASGNTESLTGNVRIGMNYDNSVYGNRSFNGSIDDVMVFKRALSVTEIQALYSSTLYKYGGNFSTYADGSYNYTAYAQDLAGNVNSTTRTVTLDPRTPNIAFTSPTPSNASSVGTSYIEVNVSSSDTNNHSVLVDWRRSLVAWWRFNNETGENNSQFKDFSSWGNNATCVGENCSVYSTGKRGKALTFDGSGDYHTVADSASLSITNDITIALWLYPNAASQQMAFVSKGASGYSGTSWEFYVNSANKLVLENGATITATNTTSASKWQHVVAVANSTNTQFYINGIADAGNPNGDAGISNAARSIFIGKKRADTSLLNGAMDDIMIFNRALSEAEVVALYNASSSPSSPYYNSFTLLSEGDYNFTAYAQDLAGNVNTTGFRTVTVGIPPQVSFVSPTPADGAALSTLYAQINTSIIESSLGEIVFDWNGTNYTFYNDSLVLLLNFDNRSALGENTSQIADLSKYQYNATCAGTACPIVNASGRYGQARTFDGVDDTFGLGNIFNFPGTTPFAFSFWLNVGGNTSGQILSKFNAGVAGQWSVSLTYNTTQTNLINFHREVSPWGLLSASSIPNNTWTHVATSYNGTAQSIYINGILQGTQSSGGVPYGGNSPDTNPVYIGAYRSSGTLSDFLDGSLDDLMVFNRSLNGSEIRQLYFTSLTKYNSSDWSLFVNQSNLTDGQSYTYQAHARDTAGNRNQTGQRTLSVDVAGPQISFVSPTVTNDSFVTLNYAQANVSFNDSDLASFAFAWNGTNFTPYNGSLVLMMNFDNISALGENGSVFKDASRYGNNGR